MDKMRRFIYERKKTIAAVAVLLVVTVLLCIPTTLRYAVKVFGWAVWFYLAVGIFITVMRALKKPFNLTTKATVFLCLAVFFAIATLHVACLNRTFTASFTDYIVGSYDHGSAGGAIFGILTSPFAVWFTYVWAIVAFLLLSALFFFLFFRPFIFSGTKSPLTTERKSKKKDAKEKSEAEHMIILDDAPFLNPNRPKREKPVEGKKEPVKKPVPLMTEEAFNEEEDAFKQLFSNVEEDVSPSVFSDETHYDVTRSDRLITSLSKEEPEDVTNEEAADLLLGEEEEEPPINFGTTPVMPKEGTESIIFEEEEDKSIPDLLKPNPSSPIMQALTRSATESFAPPPIEYGEKAFETYVGDEEENEVEEIEEEPTEETEYEEETVAPAPVSAANGGGVSNKYVFYNGQIVPVVNTPVQRTQESGQVLNIEPDQIVTEKVKEVEPPRNPAFAPRKKDEFDEEEEKPIKKPKEEIIKNEDGSTYRMVELVVREDEPYAKPPVSILKDHRTENFVDYVDNEEELREIIEVKLKNYGVDAVLIEAIKGPTVTLCKIQLGEKCPIKKLYSIKDDIQRLLKSDKPIAIISQIPGTDYCGIQIPNRIKGVVGFKEILSNRKFFDSKADIAIALGKTAEGEVLIEDLAAMPHALVAGETGSGKSVCLNVIMSSIIFRYSPEEVQLLLIDMKEVEMALYADLPHMLLRNPLSQIPEICNALKWIREEVASRFRMFKNMHIRNLTEYNARPGVKKLPRIVIIIDEASELMTDKNARSTLESTLNSLARIARAAGVHLLFATQNPVKEVITSEIQNNLPTKIAFAVGDYVHSMVIFKAKGAECLLGRGDMYIKRGTEMQRAQCAFISTEELEEAVQYIKENNHYEFNDIEIEKILNGSATNSAEEKKAEPQSKAAASGGRQDAVAEEEGEGENGPDINWLALKYCVDSNYVSCSYLQRRLKRGYNTVANILEELAAEGYISSVPQGSKDKREVLISKEDFYAEWEKRFGKSEEDDEDL